MKLHFAALMTLIFLTACSNTQRVGNEGLTVPSYTAAQTRQVYNEITDDEGNIIAPMTAEFLKDYKVLRDQARVR